MVLLVNWTFVQAWIKWICMLGMLTTGSAAFAENNLSPSEKPLVVILIGPPGAGKGTHAGPLSEQLHLPHISTGDLFREHIRNQSPLGKQAKSYMDQGNLVPDALVFDMLFLRIEHPDCAHGYILDGFPRTLPQAQTLYAKLESKAQIIALNFIIPDSALIQRITGRLMCKQCGRPYHKTFDPPPASNHCQSCEGDLYQRDDDKENVVRKRLDVYHEQTEPIIAYFAKKPNLLRTVDALNSKAQVYQDILQSLPLPVSAP